MRGENHRHRRLLGRRPLRSDISARGHVFIGQRGHRSRLRTEVRRVRCLLGQRHRRRGIPARGHIFTGERGHCAHLRRHERRRTSLLGKPGKIGPPENPSGGAYADREFQASSHEVPRVARHPDPAIACTKHQRADRPVRRSTRCDSNCVPNGIRTGSPDSSDQLLRAGSRPWTNMRSRGPQAAKLPRTARHPGPAS